MGLLGKIQGLWSHDMGLSGQVESSWSRLGSLGLRFGALGQRLDPLGPSLRGSEAKIGAILASISKANKLQIWDWSQSEDLCP